MSDSLVDDAALGRYYNYLEDQAPNYAGFPHAEHAARMAFIAGFRSGGNWALKQSAALASPTFQDAIRALAVLVKEEPGGN